MDSAWTAMRLCATAALTLLLGLVAVGSASAGLPDSVALVKDIRSGGAGSDSISPLSAQHFVVVGDKIYFVVDDGTNGKELWRSNGTEAGTTIVEDIGNGSDGSDPSSLANVGGTLYFSANDGNHGAELWRSDGSAGGTDIVKDIQATADLSSSPVGITAMGGIAYFVAGDNSGRKLWRSDGTDAGTQPVVNSGGPTNIDQLQAINGTLYFTADAGNELWRTDGSEAGTQLVKDVNDGPNGAGIQNLTTAGATIFFTFSVVGNDAVLWKTDGTNGGTAVVPGQVASFNPTGLAPLGNSVLFRGNGGSSNNELWRSDGSGVELVKEINLIGQSLPTDLRSIGGIIYFLANGPAGQEPWRSDGTEAGTFQLKNIDPIGSSYAGRFTDFSGKVMFAASDSGFSNAELWRSDGTGPGTSQLGNINPTGSSSPNYLTKLGGKLLFGADDGSHGFELWRAVDTIVPQTTIDSGPAEGQTVANSTPTFGFSSDDNPATFECSVDGGAFAACSSPGALPALSNGAHALAVRAIDEALNVDPTPAQRNFTVKVEAAATQVPGTGDRQAPKATLSAASAQKLGRALAVTVSCANEACVATAAGTVNRSKLGTATKSIAKGGTGKLQLKIPKKLAKSIKKALRARKKATADIQVVVADAAGNKLTLNKKIRLKP